MNEYSQALGYGFWCNRDCAERKIAAGIPPLGSRRSSKETEASADELLAQAALEKSREEDSSWTPLQVAGVVGASLIGIALMVVIIKKARK